MIKVKGSLPESEIDRYIKGEISKVLLKVKSDQ